MSSKNGSPEPKVSLYVFFHFWLHFIDSPCKIVNDEFWIWYIATNKEFLNELPKQPLRAENELVIYFLILTPFHL